MDHKEEFSDKVRDLEAKFTANSSSQASDKKPKVSILLLDSLCTYAFIGNMLHCCYTVRWYFERIFMGSSVVALP